MTARRSAAVLAVDGGNSKTDLALVDRRGHLLAAVRGPSCSHQRVPIDVAVRRLTLLARRARRDAGLAADSAAEVGLYSLAGADLPSDVRMLRRSIGATGLAGETVIVNDAFGALRAGSDEPWGVVLVCGAGVNAAGVAPNGRTARLAALGDISGDWGGGNAVGMAALAAAVRARDGRGERTRLERDVPAHFGLKRPADVTQAMYRGRVAQRRAGELAPLVFRAAEAGDAVARGIVDRLADELVTMALAIIRRLGMLRAEFDVVLAGGVFRTRERRFYAVIERGITESAPHARLKRLEEPPVLGAVLLGLEQLGGRPRRAAVEELRSDLRDWDARVGRSRTSAQEPAARS